MQQIETEITSQEKLISTRMNLVEQNSYTKENAFRENILKKTTPSGLSRFV